MVSQAKYIENHSLASLALIKPMTGWPGFTITSDGKVYKNGVLKVVADQPGRSLKIVIKKGKNKYYTFGLAKLIAQHFIPNPSNYTLIKFKDGNNRNCTKDNIEWISTQEMYKLSLGKNRSIATKQRARTSKRKISAVIETEDLKQIKGFAGYSINSEGEVFKDGLPKKISFKPGRSPKVLIRVKRKMYTLGLGKIIAESFIPNPNNYKRIIYKDGNKLNYLKENIEWVSNSVFARYLTRMNKPVVVLKQVKQLVPEVENALVSELNDLPGYYITTTAKIFKGAVEKKIFYKKRFFATICINGKKKILSVARLVAKHFVPNPCDHRFIIHKDRNNKNCLPENIEWVDGTKYINWNLNGKRYITPKKEKPKRPQRVRTIRTKIIRTFNPPEVDNCALVELNDLGFPGYYLTSNGCVFHFEKQLKLCFKRIKPPRIRISKNGKVYFFSLPKTLAEYFIPNPKGYNHIIFKDYDFENYDLSNLVWVPGDVYMEYCCGSAWRDGSRGRKKIIHERDFAIKNTRDDDIRAFYTTLDDAWLQICWGKLSKEYKKFHWWMDIQSECYIYFIDRAKRFSIIQKPGAVIWYYARGQRQKLWQEISSNLPFKELLRTDESLRDTRSYQSYNMKFINEGF